jgi:hypothetical protein
MVAAVEKHLEELTDEDVVRRFVGAMELLSLDRVRSFWLELGLKFDRADIVLGAIRSFAVAFRAIEDEDGYEDDPFALEEVPNHARRLFSTLRLSEGEQSVETLWNWLETGYGNEPSWSWGWRILLYHWSELEPENLVRWGFTAEHARQSLRLAEEWVEIVDDIQARVSNAEQEPLQGWDAEADRRFREQMKKHAEEEGEAEPEFSPEDSLAGLTEALERRYFGRVWARLVRLLTIPEMEAALRWGRRKAQELEFGDIEVPGEASPEAEVPAEWRVQN